MAKARKSYSSPYGGGGWWGATTVADIQQEMTGTTNVFGRDKSIRVMFAGNDVTVKNGVVTFPAMDNAITLESSTVRMMRGLVDHEAAIARFSNRQFMASREEMQQSSPEFYALFRAIEGARVEQAYTEFYSGAGKNLAELTSAVFKDVKETVTEEMDLYPTAIAMFAQKRMPGVFNTWQCLQMGNLVNAKTVEGWVDEITTFTTSRESYELAERIYRDNGKQPPPRPSGKNSDKNKGEADDDGEGSDWGEDDEDDSGSEGDSQSALTRAVKKSLDSDKNNPNYKATYDHSDINGPYIPLTTEYDRVLHWKSDGFVENVAAYTRAKESMGAELATAKRKLELLIQATQKISWDTMKERGRLDSRRLVGAYQGETDVFKVKKDASDLDTAIVICIDMSGSMHGSKAEHAFLGALVFAELLSKIGVPFEVTGFNTQASGWHLNPVYAGSYRGNAMEYARLSALHKFDFKRFGDRFFDARKYMHRMTMCGGANVDGESIALAAKPLLARPEKRKIMFVLSDGQPSSDGNDNRLFGHLQRTVKDLATQLEIVGIGIKSAAVKNFYPTYIVLEDSKNLPEILLKLLGEKLLPKKKKAA